ncbi:hypothetical protein [Treponema sp.]|uniref:hypothetical protein n=1 Tax=Treponema sp. TaxID=166 RepID=UPI00298E4081|nr:hypothetical protein [Treponema sp.]
MRDALSVENKPPVFHPEPCKIFIVLKPVSTFIFINSRQCIVYLKIHRNTFSGPFINSAYIDGTENRRSHINAKRIPDVIVIPNKILTFKFNGMHSFFFDCK